MSLNTVQITGLTIILLIVSSSVMLNTQQQEGKGLMTDNRVYKSQSCHYFLLTISFLSDLALLTVCVLAE